MKRSLVMHIGAHKTASSLLQSAMKADFVLLQANNLDVYFWKDIVKSNLQKALHSLDENHACPDSLLAGKESLNAFLAKSNGRIVLFSNEDLLTNLDIRSFYTNAGKKMEYLRDSTPPGFGFRVILYVRSQADYLESVYLQYIHLGRSLSFKSFLGENIPDNLSWFELANSIERVVGASDLIIKPFEQIKRLGSQEFYKDFLESVGYIKTNDIQFCPDLEQSRAANRSYSQLAIEIAKRVHPLLQTKDEKIKLRAFLQTSFSTATHKRASFLSEDERLAIKSMYSESNRALFRAYIPEMDGTSMNYY